VEDRRERFEALASQVWDPLQRYLRRRCAPQVAEDVLGDVLLVLWRRLDDAPAGAELPWSYAVARGCLANARRGEDRRLSLVSRMRRERPPEPPVPDDRVGAALTRLRPADAEVLRLWAWEGLEARDLATVLGCSAGAAANRLSRARAALREQLRQDDAGAGHTGQREGEGRPR
jgi:RNA polymerase sigma-70 factor (ECF subfamily)